MTPFQLVFVTILVGLALREGLLMWTARLRRSVGTLRAAVWLAAAIAILVPDAVTRFAQIWGVQRGADIVLYLFALAFLYTSFYFYARCHELELRLTRLVRSLALADAARGRSAEEETSAPPTVGKP